MKSSGRPVGAKTKDRKIIEHTPTACPHCLSVVSPVQLSGKRRIEASGETPDGRPYGAVILRNANCGSCGCPLIVRTYEFVSEIHDAN